MAINWDEEDSTEEQELPADVIKSVQLQIQANNEHVLINSEHRNVLMVGRTRSGKSTTLEVLKDPCYTPPNDTIFSETVDSKCWSFALKRRSQDGRTVDYSLNLIDTPGLFEVKGGQSGEERTNEVIKNTISQCLENEITHIHAIIMFVTFEAGINREDIQANKRLRDHQAVLRDPSLMSLYISFIGALQRAAGNENVSAECKLRYVRHFEFVLDNPKK